MVLIASAQSPQWVNVHHQAATAISLLLSELLSSLLGAQRDRAIAINVEDCRGNAKCQLGLFFLMCDCARKGIWFVLLDRHVYLTVQTYIHSYIGSYIHRQFVLIAFWSLMSTNVVRMPSTWECYATFVMVKLDSTGFKLPRLLSVPHGRSNQPEIK